MVFNKALASLISTNATVSTSLVEEVNSKPARRVVTDIGDPAPSSGSADLNLVQVRITSGTFLLDF